jgi:hypothetical protein
MSLIGRRWRPGQNIVKVFLLLVVDLPEQAIEQHLGKADDRVEWRPQLMRHVRQELRLVAGGHLELQALVLDLAEEPRILDGQGGLGREGLEQVHHVRGELSGGLATDDEAAQHVVFADEGDGQQRPVAGGQQQVPHGTLVGGPRHVGDLHRLAQGGGPPCPSPLGIGRWRVASTNSGEVVARAAGGTLGGRVVLVDGAAVRVGELVRVGGDGGQHRLRCRVEAQRPAPRRGRQLLYRPANRGPGFAFGEEGGVFDDDRLVGEGLHHRDLLVREGRGGGAADDDR